MLVVLSGGTGGAKLIEGLSHEIDAAQLTVVCNTADDFVLHGLNISRTSTRSCIPSPV